MDSGPRNVIACASSSLSVRSGILDACVVAAALAATERKSLVHKFEVRQQGDGPLVSIGPLGVRVQNRAFFKSLIFVLVMCVGRNKENRD